MKKIAVSLLLSYVFIGMVIGQDLKGDIAHMKAQLSQSKYVSLDYSLKVYRDVDAKEVLLTEQKGYARKSGENTLSRVNNVTSVQNKEYFLIIDDELKMMQVLDLSTVDQEKSKELLRLTPNEKEHNLEEIQFLESENGMSHYMLKGKGAIGKTEVFVDDSKRFFKRLVYYYNATDYQDATKVVLEYSLVDFTTKPNEGQFLTKKYIHKKQGEYTGTSPYSTYQIIVDDHEE